MKSVRLSEIVAVVGGRLIGVDCEVLSVASLSRAKEGDITFVLHKKYVEQARSSGASAFVTVEGIELPEKNCLAVKNGSLAQAKILSLFYPQECYEGVISGKASVSPHANVKLNVTVMEFAYISEGAVLEEGSVIYPFVYIGRNAKIGKNTRVYPHSVVMDNVEIGNDVILYPGVVIGSDGFGYTFDGRAHVKIPQVGKVVIEDNVEIGANSTVDKAAMDVTRIGKGTKIDNLVMIGHNVSMGENCILAGQVGIAGSTEIGKEVVIGGQAGVSDHVIIEDKVMIAGGSGVTRNIPKGEKIAGFPAVSFIKWLKIQTILESLPEMKKKLNYLYDKFGNKEG
jgi:UDP-3-O-[3-hydroxymyristoyl] glucosamine N-acyltransferase